MTEPRTWRVIDLIKWTTDYFARRGITSARLDAEVLLAHILECSRLDLYMNFDAPVAPKHREIYREAVRKRAARIPVAYIIGYKEFMDCRLKVDSRVLIPRPETELLVETVSERIGGKLRGNLIDVGTGSGAIAISLARAAPDWHIFACDLSPEAIDLARENAERIGVKIEFRVSDLLSEFGGEKFDWIVSNPPYVRTGKLNSLEPEVYTEPRLALDGGPDGLAVIRRLIAQAGESLISGGWLAMEIGYDQAKSVIAMMESSGFSDIETVKDLAGIERVVIGSHRA